MDMPVADRGHPKRTFHTTATGRSRMKRRKDHRTFRIRREWYGIRVIRFTKFSPCITRDTELTDCMATNPDLYDIAAANGTILNQRHRETD